MKKNLLVTLFLLIGSIGFAQNSIAQASFNKASLKWWQESRFGMFIHWGPVTRFGGEISWTREGYGKAKYDSLYKGFNPVKFNPEEWVTLAKEAGMNYIVFTAKHHDGFYEWKTETGQKTKTPYFIHMKDRKPFAFAGLWDEWHSPEGGILRTCTIITTEPNELMSNLHNRMPVILDKKNYADWLEPAPHATRRENLLHLIQPFPADRMSAYPVSTLVNIPGNDRPELIVSMEK